MSIRIIMTPMSGLEGADASLETALQVGRMFEAHVESFHVTSDPRDSVAYMAEGMTSNMIQDIMDAVDSEGRQRLDRARAQFGALCAKFDVSASDARNKDGFGASFVHAVGREEDHIAHRGRLTDLIVAGRSDPNDGSARTTLEIALLETGRPVLVAPPRVPASFGKTLAIAWNGSAVAAHAIGAGLPFLRAAESVSIFVVPEGARSGVPASELINYLACHGIDASARRIDASEAKIGRALMDAASGSGTDMLVMGAYTHSRLRHLIFGGATSGILEHAEIPVLMQH
jgi:nucleotide-binding universal stress UspA family protein